MIYSAQSNQFSIILTILSVGFYSLTLCVSQSRAVSADAALPPPESVQHSRVTPHFFISYL